MLTQLLHALVPGPKPRDSPNVAYLLGVPRSGKTLLFRQICRIPLTSDQNLIKSKIFCFICTKLEELINKAYECNSPVGSSMKQLLLRQPCLIKDKERFLEWIDEVETTIWKDDAIQQCVELNYKNNNFR